jgi:hypothetical protein
MCTGIGRLSTIKQKTLPQIGASLSPHTMVLERELRIPAE